MDLKLENKTTKEKLHIWTNMEYPSYIRRFY